MTMTTSVDPLLLLGAMTTTQAENLRAQVRRLQPAAVGVRVLFVLGADCLSSVQSEAHRHRDLVGVNTSECSISDRDERKQQLSAKVYHWFRYAITQRSRWIGKTDDDTLSNLHKLRSDLLSAEAYAEPCGHPKSRCGLYGYYGTMRWRRFRTDRWKPCGPLTELGPPDVVPEELTQPPASCDAGPFPYADGSLYVVSSPLAKRVWGGEIARRLAASPSGWSEDVRSGFLVYAESLAQQLPTTWLAVRAWVHMRFWLDSDDPAQAAALDGRVVWVHRMKHPADAKLTSTRLWALRNVGANHGASSLGGFHCAESCAAWWRGVHGRIVEGAWRCCHRPT